MASCLVNTKSKGLMDSKGERGGLQGGLAGFLATQPSHHHIRTPPPFPLGSCFFLRRHRLTGLQTVEWTVLP